MLDTYRDMNAQIAADYNVTFLDVRSKSLATIPSIWPLNKYYLTMDGEHPNERGARIEADLFATQLNHWLARNGYAGKPGQPIGAEYHSWE